jgi:hypothetical protein
MTLLGVSESIMQLDNKVALVTGSGRPPQRTVYCSATARTRLCVNHHAAFAITGTIRLTVPTTPGRHCAGC